MLQDIVAPGCGPDGNAVQGFVRSFTSEKSDFQHDALRAVHREDEDLRHRDEFEHDLHEIDAPRLSHAPLDRDMQHFLAADRAVNRADPLNMLHPPPPMERVWSEQRHRVHPREREAWAREFAEVEDRSHPWVNEFARPQSWVEERSWAEEFEHADEADFEQAWREGTNDEWAAEFGAKMGAKAEDEEEAEWYEQFLKKEAQRKEDNKEILQQLNEKLAAITDPKLRQSNFVRFINRVSTGEVVLQDGQAIEVKPAAKGPTDWAEEFAAKEEQGEWSAEFARRERKGSWAAEFEERAREARQEETDEWAREFEEKQKEKEDWLREFQENEEEEWARDYARLQESEGWNPQGLALQGLDSYAFAEDNPYRNHSDPFSRGKELLARAQLSEAILAFEAEVQRHPDNSEAWRLLGQTHAQNDKDDRAIAALRKAVALNNRDMDAHIALAVSYTNELYRDEALSSLERWLQYHPDYKHLLPQGRVDHDEWGNEFDEGGVVDKQDKVTELFLAAARLRPTNIDPDVQIALGLLFNLSFEYDKAVECFSLALQKRPEDYLLWNKLGATLANSNRSQEAIDVYWKALDFNPNFVRARANLGISFLALKDYDNASRQFVQALRLQPTAQHIWANLRTSLTAMQRNDLLMKSMKFDIKEFEEFD